VIEDNALFCTVCGKPVGVVDSGQEPEKSAPEAAVVSEGKAADAETAESKDIEAAAVEAASADTATQQNVTETAAETGSQPLPQNDFQQPGADPGAQGFDQSGAVQGQNGYQQPGPAQGQYGYQQQGPAQGQYGYQQPGAAQYGYQQQMNQQYGYIQQPRKQYPSYKPEYQTDKFLSLLCYTGFIGVLLAYFGGDWEGKRSDYLKFHANQGLVFNLLALPSLIPFIGPLWGIFVLVCQVIAFVKACQGKTEPVLFFGLIRIIQ
jgi:hypothetical protein